jgi:hypothetical protein
MYTRLYIGTFIIGPKTKRNLPKAILKVRIESKLKESAEKLIKIKPARVKPEPE